MITLWNPIDDVLQAAQAVYKDIDVIVQFDPHLKKTLLWGAWGETYFPEDGSTPIVSLSPHLQFKHILEILAHELAHVISGVNAKHGEEWESCFSAIHDEYNKIIIARQDAEGVGRIKWKRY